MAELFETTLLDGIELRNRFVRSATNEGMAEDDGSCTQRLIDLCRQLVHGQVGLIISGHMYVSKQGKAGRNQTGIYTDGLIDGLSRLTDAVHRDGGKIICQIAHAGLQADSDLTGLEPIGPSVIKAKLSKKPRQMSVEDIDRVVKAFGDAAGRAKKSGFDGVQIHAAHGYLLSQFLSGFYNKRTDNYGGSVANRARIVLEVFNAVRESVGDNFHVQIKLNAADFLEDGFTVDEMLVVAKMLEDAGIGAIELSGGAIDSSGEYSPVRVEKRPSREWEVFYRDQARRFKETINIPLLLVGGIRSCEVAEQIVSDGIADYISLCRPLIAEPLLVKRWADGDRRRAECVSDNACFGSLIKGQGLYCVTGRKKSEKQ